MLQIENRGRLISDSFYDKMGMYWVVRRILDDPNEYLIVLECQTGPKELFSLNKQKRYALGYQFGISAGGPSINQRMFKVKTYIPIETIKDKTLLVSRMKDMINHTYDI
jgi:hypothetical protein